MVTLKLLWQTSAAVSKSSRKCETRFGVEQGRPEKDVQPSLRPEKDVQPTPPEKDVQPSLPPFAGIAGK